MSWKPIETAPMDGSHILICKAYNADGRIIDKESFGLFVHRASWWDTEWIVYNSVVCEQQPFFEPTHWMPLPPPPETDQ